MDRLQAQSVGIDDDAFAPGFVSPTLINEWVRYLAQIRPNVGQDQTIPERHRRNIGYRLQLMEFECALILLNIETQRRFRNGSTLHSTVAAFKNHQFIVLAHSVLEGIGAHIFRVASQVGGHEVDARRRVNTADWQAALVRQLLPQDDEAAHNAKRSQLENLFNWRNLIHMDRVELNDPLHFDQLYGVDRFVDAYNIFRSIMTGLNPRWPQTCLNEDIELGRAALG